MWPKDSACRGATIRDRTSASHSRRRAHTGRTAKTIFARSSGSVSPGFFATMGVPILEGRDFNDGDKEGNERVVIISQSLAQ